MLAMRSQRPRSVTLGSERVANPPVVDREDALPFSTSLGEPRRHLRFKDYSSVQNKSRISETAKIRLLGLYRAVMLSHDSQLRVEQELKRLRRGFTCNVQRLNRWAAHLNERACHEDLYDAGGLIVEDSLVQEAMQWDGPLEIQPTSDEVTVVLRAKVVWLVEEYFERVLFMVAGELATLPMLARDFNTQLANVHRLLMSGYPGLLREGVRAIAGRLGIGRLSPMPRGRGLFLKLAHN
jgi:hypothetical protein